MAFVLKKIVPTPNVSNITKSAMCEGSISINSKVNILISFLHPSYLCSLRGGRTSFLWVMSWQPYTAICRLSSQAMKYCLKGPGNLELFDKVLPKDAEMWGLDLTWLTLAARRSIKVLWKVHLWFTIMAIWMLNMTHDQIRVLFGEGHVPSEAYIERFW